MLKRILLGLFLTSVAVGAGTVIYKDAAQFKSSVQVDSLTASRALTSNSSKVLTSSSVTDTELGYLSGVTSSVQTQLTSKLNKSGDTMTGNLSMGANTITNATLINSAGINVSGLTASTALQTDGSKNLQSSSVTTTELGYLSGVTSAIQTQLGTKATNPMTTAGDIIYGGASGVPTRLAGSASNGHVLTYSTGSSAPTWAAASGAGGMIINAYKAGASNCQWTRSSSSLGAFSTDTDCPAITVISQAQCTVTTSDDDLPQLVLTSCPVGKFKVTATFSNTYSGGAQAITYALSDGTTTCGQQQYTMDGTVTTGTTLMCVFEYGSTGSHTFQVFGATSGTAIRIENTSSTLNRLEFVVEYTP